MRPFIYFQIFVGCPPHVYWKHNHNDGHVLDLMDFISNEGGSKQVNKEINEVMANCAEALKAMMQRE